MTTTQAPSRGCVLILTTGERVETDLAPKEIERLTRQPGKVLRICNRTGGCRQVHRKEILRLLPIY